MRKSRGNTVLNLLILAALIGIGILANTHRTQIIDWWWFRTYAPPAQVTSLADDAGMNATGRHWLYRTGPLFAGQDELNTQCGNQQLGCILPSGRAYILTYDPASEPSRSQAVVTATHEMLHMVWRRTSKTEKARVKAMLLDAQTQLLSDDLNQRVAAYTDPDEQIDELHSILGSEFSGLPADLETYYAKYFSDRSKVTDAATHQPSN